MESIQPIVSVKHEFDYQKNLAYFGILDYEA